MTWMTTTQARNWPRLRPDVVGTTAITPSIYVAERTLQLAKEVLPGRRHVLGGIHATFMYKQVL
jgi:anaerobic magnesium-protoporphyrin IX monomethyl ester cyclase